MRKFTSLLLLGFALGSFAQTPGGVSGSELWFKTAPLNSDLQGYYRWQDFSGDSIRLMLLDSRGVKSELTLPNSSVHFFNFNPSLWLADGFRSLSAKLKHGNLSQATVIGVFAPELATIGKDMVVYALDGRKGDGVILSKDKAVRGRGVEPLDYGSASGEDLLYQSSDSLSENGFKESALRVVSYFKVSNPSTTLWGDNSNTTLFIGTPSTSGSFGTDFPTSLFGNASIRGYAPELIVFSRMLTPDERRKVESYLAVKYGITLKGSYLDSDGNLTWDMAENQAYHHRVTAVGTDTAGSLSQPLSATYISLLVNTINSKEVHSIEYLKDGEEVSSSGYSDINKYLNSIDPDSKIGDAFRKREERSDGSTRYYYDDATIQTLGGEGFNVPTSKGSHSFIRGVQDKLKAVTSAHELLGHGLPSARKESPVHNNTNAIRTDNLVRRLLRLPQRDGSDHAGGKDIVSPYSLPYTK